MTDRIFDCDGKPMYVGDYVECRTDGYPSMPMGQRRRIQEIVNGCIVLANNTEYGYSNYTPTNFRRASQHSPQHKKEQKVMLHIAIRTTPNFDYAALAIALNDVTAPIHFLADTSQDALKEKLRVRIGLHPDEKWLILSGNTIAEMASPPIRFRSV